VGRIPALTYDSAWDMPKANWVQQGSFAQGEIPPIYDPDAAPLICLPPINQYWLPFILGCLDQLRNPSSWLVADDNAMFAVLTRANRLMQMVGERAECAVPVEMRLQDCVLQYSNDGGSTWVDTTDWVTNFRNCVQSSIPPAIPPNPGGTPHDQHACNLAGYLAAKVIQETMSTVHSVVLAGQTELQFGIDVMSLIGFAFPITYAASLAFHDFWTAVSGQVLADINTAATDATLWSDVTCAIFSAIRTVGYVDATNFSAVSSNLAAITYMFGWVAPSIHNYWNELGLSNIQSQQAIGALDEVDCTSCASTELWCREDDFRVGVPHGWSEYSGSGWVLGQGFTSIDDGVHSVAGCQLRVPATQFDNLSFGFICTADATVQWAYYLGGVNIVNHTTLFGGSSSQQFWGGTFDAEADRLILQVYSTDRSASMTITEYHLDGHGLNPIGATNCTHE